MSDYTPKLPEVKFNKNGYEIRTDILSMAKDLVGQEYHAKYMAGKLVPNVMKKPDKLLTK